MPTKYLLGVGHLPLQSVANDSGWLCQFIASSATQPARRFLVAHLLS